MDTGENDRKFLIAAASVLETWLLSEKSSFPIFNVVPSPQGKGLIPALTAGTLLLSEARLGINLKSPDLREIHQSIQTTRYNWRSAWQKKIVQDFKSRLARWGQQITDWFNEDVPSDSLYRVEIRERVMLELLLERMEVITPVAANELTRLDDILEGLTRESPFIWQDISSDLFPPYRYFYMYRLFKSVKKGSLL